MEALRSLLTRSTHVAVLAHVSPDGDAVGSVLALSAAINQLGITAHPVLRDSVPAVFSYLPGAEKVLSDIPEETDLCILVDMNDLSRSGFDDCIRGYARAGTLITIDHHPKGDLSRFSKVYIHEETASSVCEMLARLIPELGLKVTPDIALSLLTGIYTDTGGFQHENASVKTLEVASELMKRGGHLNTIARNISNTKSISALKLLGVALDGMKVVHDGMIAVSAITGEDLKKCGASSEDIPGIVNELNAAPGILMSVLLVQTEPGLIRGTMRSGERSNVRVSSLAKVFGGGGHPKAAGFSASGTLERDGSSWRIL